MLRCNPTRLLSSMMRTFNLFLLISFIVLASAIPSSKTASLAHLGSSISFAKTEKDSLRTRSSVTSPSIQNGWSKKDVKFVAPVRVNFASQESEEETKKPRLKNSLLMSVRQQGLSGSKCSSSEECQGERTCQDEILGDTRCALPDATFVQCNVLSDCEEPGEECLENTKTGVTICLSQDFASEVGASVDESEPSTVSQDTVTNDNDPCIAIDSLRHLSREQLVFENDILSNVLCDKNLSCATAGHMVTYQGKGMMMKSYCEAVGGCMKRVMLVNSPRYRMKLAVPSKSDNLVFTAMSARYITRAEEQVLSAAIRMGL